MDNETRVSVLADIEAIYLEYAGKGDYQLSAHEFDIWLRVQRENGNCLVEYQGRRVSEERVLAQNISGNAEVETWKLKDFPIESQPQDTFLWRLRSERNLLLQRSRYALHKEFGGSSELLALVLAVEKVLDHPRARLLDVINNAVDRDCLVADLRELLDNPD